MKKTREQILKHYFNRLTKSDAPFEEVVCSITNMAIKNGILIKPENCSKCGIKKWFKWDRLRYHRPLRRRIEGHHNDYNLPLDVEWLCNPCHIQKHREMWAVRFEPKTFLQIHNLEEEN